MEGQYHSTTIVRGASAVVTDFGVSEFASVELGLGMRFDNAQAVNAAKFQMGMSGTFLGHLQHWNMVDNYVFGGLVFRKLPQPNDNIQVSLMGGFQPEIVLMEHFAVGVRVGAIMQVAPDFMIQTTGDPLSIVSGVRFTLLF